MDLKQFYRDKIILVTGGAGAIGRNLVEAISIFGAKKIIVLDNLSSSFQWNIPNNHNVLFIHGDIRRDDDLRRVFHHKPTIVFHLASFFANQNSIDYPLENESVNGTGMLKLMEYCVISGIIERFVYTNSEGGAYGHDCVLPYQEDFISYQLSSPYYISKMTGEAYCNYYHMQYNLPVSILRLFNSFGPGEVPGPYRNVIPNFIYWALRKQPLPLTGNINISRDFTFVMDIVQGILRAGAISDAIAKPINIASGTETLIYELAELINNKTSNPAGVKILEKRKWDSRGKIIGSNNRCHEILGFKPQSNLDHGLDLTIKWFHDNWHNIEKSIAFSPGINPALDV